MASVLENPAVRRRALPISVEQYHQLGAMGLIVQPTELLRGFIVEKVNKSPLHTWLVQFLVSWMRQGQTPQWHVRQEQPLTLVDSEPEPDVAIVTGQPDNYLDAHPTTAIVLIEVAVSSLEIDREKASLYAQAGVLEYAIVNPVAGTVELYSQPTASGFLEKKTLNREADLAFSWCPSRALPLNQLFKD